MFQGDAQHTGRSLLTGPSVSNTVITLSSVAAGSPIDCTPTVMVDGTIVFTNENGNVYAVTPEPTVTTKWTFTPMPLITSYTRYFLAGAAIAPDGTSYAGNGLGILYAISAAGLQLWTFSASLKIFHTPTLGPDGTVYFGNFDDTAACSLFALTPSGGLKWQFPIPTGKGQFASPTLSRDGETVYTHASDGHLYAVFAANGTQQWAYTGPTYVGNSDSAPVIGLDGAIYYGHFDGNVYAVNANGTQRWVYRIGYQVSATAAIGLDGSVIIGGYDKVMRSLDPVTGDVLWTFATDHSVYSRAAVVDVSGAVYFSDDFVVYALTGSGSLLWRATTPAGCAPFRSSVVIVSPGVLAFGCSNGRLMGVVG